MTADKHSPSPATDPTDPVGETAAVDGLTDGDSAVEHLADGHDGDAGEREEPAATVADEAIPSVVASQHARPSEEASEPSVSAEAEEEEGESEAAPAPPSEAYFEDDEEFLKGDDAVLSSAEDAALFQQLDHVVAYNLRNFYDEEGKRRSKRSLRHDPPVFRVEDSSGDFAEFVVTRELSAHLAQLFDVVHRGYYGVEGKKGLPGEEREPRSKLQEVTHWVESNPKRSITLASLLVLALLAAFLLGS